MHKKMNRFQHGKYLVAYVLKVMTQKDGKMGKISPFLSEK